MLDIQMNGENIIYAELNKENICDGLSSLSDEVTDENMIRIETYDMSILGKKYVNGVWEEIPVEPIIPEPTEQEKLILELVTTIMEINAKLGSV